MIDKSIQSLTRHPVHRSLALFDVLLGTSRCASYENVNYPTTEWPGPCEIDTFPTGTC